MTRSHRIIAHTSLLPAQTEGEIQFSPSVQAEVEAGAQKLKADNDKRVADILTRIANGTDLYQLSKGDIAFLWNYALGHNDQLHAPTDCRAEDGAVVNDPTGNEHTLMYPMKNGAVVYFNFSNGAIVAYRHQDDKPNDVSDFAFKNEAGAVQVRVGSNPENIPPDIMYGMAQDRQHRLDENLKTGGSGPPCVSRSSNPPPKAAPALH